MILPNSARRVTRTGELRGGATLIFVLLCLVTLMLVSGALMRLLVLQRQAERLAERRIQSDYFAESAWQRGVLRAGREPGYMGETWRVTLDDHGSPRSAVATMEVVRDGSQAASCVLRVATKWPENDQAAIATQVERTIQLPIPPSTKP